MNNKVPDIAKAVREMQRAGEAAASENLQLFHDTFNVKGQFQLTRLYKDGRRKVVFEDNNMVVALGRRMMSRLIAGNVGSPTLTVGQQQAFRVIRGTTGGVTSAWVTVERIAGTNEWRVTGHTNATANEFSFQFAGGSKTLATLASDITAAAGGNKWAAEVMNGLSAIDATNLVETPRGNCLGNTATYTSVPSNAPHARVLYAIATKTSTLPTGNTASLIVTRLRFGTEGHSATNETIGRDVNFTDEWLTSPLRAADLGNTTQSDDYLSVVPDYTTNPNHVKFTATLTSADANGLYISEAGLFTAGDYLVAKKNFGKHLKSDIFDLQANWTLIF